MTRWFRYYDDALDDLKVQRLSGDMFKCWVNLLSLASKSDGKIPPADVIAFRLRISTQDAQQRLEDLILATLIDIQPDGSMTPHNWSERQFVSDSSAVRMQKFRAKKRNKSTGDVTCAVSDEKSDAIESESYSDTKINPNGLHLEPARVKDQGIRFDVLKGRDDGRTKKLESRAEGLGIPVDELVAKVIAHKAKNRAAYFTKLCVEWLAPKLPGLDEQIIRDALWGKANQYQTITQLLCELP